MDGESRPYHVVQRTNFQEIDQKHVSSGEIRDYAEQRERLVFRSYLEPAPGNNMLRARLMDQMHFGPDQNITLTSA